MVSSHSGSSKQGSESDITFHKQAQLLRTDPVTAGEGKPRCPQLLNSAYFFFSYNVDKCENFFFKHTENIQPLSDTRGGNQQDECYRRNIIQHTATESYQINHSFKNVKITYLLGIATISSEKCLYLE